MEIATSSFKFLGYRVIRSLIEIQIIKEERKFEIDFEPSGIIDKKNATFTLNLKTLIIDQESIKIEIETEAYFEFKNDSPQKELDNFFYVNAPAILFPYIRAYISTLTALSGEAIVPPTLNLTSLGDRLKKNTSEK